MKSQKGGRVAMPFEFFNAGVKGPFTSNPAPALSPEVWLINQDAQGTKPGGKDRHS